MAGISFGRGSDGQFNNAQPARQPPCPGGLCLVCPSPACPLPNAKRAQQAAVTGARALLQTRVVVRVEEGVPRAEAVPVEVALHDQGRLLFLEGVPHLAQKTVQVS